MAAASKKEVGRQSVGTPVAGSVDVHDDPSRLQLVTPATLVFKIIALMGTTAAGLIASTAAMEPTIVNGMVTDQANNAISAAVVETSCVGKGELEVRTETKSGADGRWEIAADIKGRCALKISAVGFAPVLLGISSPADRTKIDVGKIRLKVSCSGPGVVCDEVTPGKDSVPEPPKKKK